VKHSYKKDSEDIVVGGQDEILIGEEAEDVVEAKGESMGDVAKFVSGGGTALGHGVEQQVNERATCRSVVGCGDWVVVWHSVVEERVVDEAERKVTGEEAEQPLGNEREY
jgi:hypothetical protein